MQIVAFKLDEETIRDLDTCAKVNKRNRSVHLREMVFAEIRRNMKKAPNAFKGAAK